MERNPLGLQPPLGRGKPGVREIRDLTGLADPVGGKDDSEILPEYCKNQDEVLG